MAGARRDGDAPFLEAVAAYRDEFRRRRSSDLREERERRHEAGQVFVTGQWVAREDARRLVQALVRHELLTFVEVVVLLTILLASAYGMWSLFKFLLLPFAS